MTELFYKAVRPNGGSFNDPDFKWATEPGGVTAHPSFHRGDASGYLSVATVPTDCTGFQWPARLLVVEAVGDVFTPDAHGLPHKRAGAAFRTVEERPAHELFGPQGEHVVALIKRAGRLTDDEARELAAAWDAAWDNIWDAVWDAARVAAWSATWDAARVAARDADWAAARVTAWAAGGLLLRDLVGTGVWTQEAYDLLTGPWRRVIGQPHPDDE